MRLTTSVIAPPSGRELRMGRLEQSDKQPVLACVRDGSGRGGSWQGGRGQGGRQGATYSLPWQPLQCLPLLQRRLLERGQRQ